LKNEASSTAVGGELTNEELWTKHPSLFHMTDLNAFENIQRFGLRSTAALLDLFDVPEPRRTELLTRRRATSITLEHAAHGRVVLRDQIPLSEARLAGCLQDGITAAEWLRLLNSKVFFWVDPRRLEGLREADAYRGTRQLVLTVDTRSLVTAHTGEIIVADRNTGATRPMAHPRGATTFLPLAQNGRRRIVELVLEGSVPDVLQHVTSAIQVGGGRPDVVLYERPPVQ
jgi:hypothetical protein